MQKRNVLHSPRLLELKKKKRNAFLKKVSIFSFGFLVVMAFLSYISRIERVNISAVEISGNNIVETDVVKDAVQKEISGKYVWLFPKTNIFLYPKNAIKTGLADEFKRFKDINLSIKGNKILAVSVTERSPKYTWCGTAPSVDNNSIETCYFLDETGYIFDTAPYFSGDVYFKFYGSTSEQTPNPAGSYFFQPNFSNLISFRDALEGMNIKPVILYIKDNGDATIYLKKIKKSIHGPEIIFNKDSNLQKVAENLKAALDTEPFKSEFKNKYSSLEYIDLRFENKVYYKFK